MPTYDVTVLCTIRKVYTVEAPDEDVARDIANQLFTVHPEERRGREEDYEQEAESCEENNTPGHVDAYHHARLGWWPTPEPVEVS